MTDFTEEKNKWDRIYNGAPDTEVSPAVNAAGKELVKIFDELFDEHTKILEAGAGTGAQSLPFAKSDKYTVHLQDFSENALKHAKALYSVQNADAKFELGDLFEHGEADFDLVYNFGVLEHYTFEEQVKALKSMASRSKRFVAVAVPNSQCIWYWLWRTGVTSIEGWPYGVEIPLPDLEKAFRHAGLRYLGHQYIGSDWTENFIIGLPDITDFQRDLFLETHRGGLFDEAQSSYLTLAFGSQTDETDLSSKGWRRSLSANDMDLPETITKVSESVSALMSSKYKHRQSEAFRDLNETAKLEISSPQALKKTIKEQKSQLQKLRNTQFKEAAQPIERILHSIENLSAQHKTALDASQEKIAKLETTQNLLTKEQKAHKEIGKSVSNVESQIQDLITDGKEQGETVNQIRKALGSLSKSNQTLATKQEEAEQTNHTLMSAMQNTLCDLTQSNQALIERQEETIRLNSEQQEKLHTAELSDARLQAMQRSLSWRLTYPLRLIGGLAKFIFAFGSRSQNKRAFLRQKRREVGTFRTIIWVLNWLSTRHLPGVPQQPNATTQAEVKIPQSPFKKLTRSKERLFRAASQDTPATSTIAILNQKHAPSIMMFADNFTAGGVERVMLDLSIQLNAQNISVVVVIANKASDMIKELDQYGISYFSLEGDQEHLRQIIATYNVKLIYSHYGFGMMDVFSTTDIPIIEVLHNAYHWQRDDQSMVDFRSTYMHSFVAVSEFVATYNQTYLNIPPEKTTIIHNGMNTNGFIRPPIELLSKKRLETISSQPNLLFVANIHPQKNHRLTVNSFKKVHELFPSAILTIAGQFDRDSELGQLVIADIKKLQLSENIHFSGLLDRTALSRLMSEAHVAILPTLFEGFSIASLEYSYFGLPSILSQTGAADHMKTTYGHVKIAPEVALNMEQLSIEAVDQNAKLAFKSAIEPLADEIIDVLDNYELWLEKACNTARAHKEYSIDSTAKSYLETYKAIIF